MPSSHHAQGWEAAGEGFATFRKSCAHAAPRQLATLAAEMACLLKENGGVIGPSETAMKSVPVAQFMTREPVTVVTRDAGVGGVGFCLDCGDRAHTGDDGPDSGNPD